MASQRSKLIFKLLEEDNVNTGDLQDENSMMGNAGVFLEEPVLADEDNISSPAPSLSFCEPNVRKTLEEVIDQVCGIDDDDKGYLEYPGNEEAFDDSDADPDYILVYIDSIDIRVISTPIMTSQRKSCKKYNSTYCT
ncbi:uncharacterized protein [Diabrotica undecimpunctata]|uniref:uncharacterized protein n=1 Tax=Diabrotica undecimpunctata TaxID=50387 RepID=UPI003B639EB4